MSKRHDALEVLAVGLVSVGAIVVLKSLLGTGRNHVQKVTDNIDPHDFTVAYSTHDNDFHFVGNDHARPQPPYKTFGEAMRTARQFIASAAPINGKAKIVNVRNGREQDVSA